MEQDQTQPTWRSLISTPKGNNNVALLLIPPILPGLVAVNNFLRPQDTFELPGSYFVAGGLSVVLLLVRQLRLRHIQKKLDAQFVIVPSADFVD